MNFKLILTGLAIGLLPGLAGAQEPSPIYLTAKDTLLLTVLEGKKYVYHPVKSRQTLFSLARFYGLGLEELYDHNPAFRNDPVMRVGMRVKIPVPNRAIKRYKGQGFLSSKHTPIYYVVQDGDNLFQICKRYFNMPVDSILKRNRLKSTNIQPGQLLQMGWMSTSGIPADSRPARTSTPSTQLRERYEQDRSKRKETESQGVCFWQRDSKEEGDLYALHREAALNSSIAVTNPMTGRTVYARVIGRIPEGYEKNVIIILSPAAARQLGARDPRFFVKIKYLE